MNPFVNANMTTPLLVTVFNLPAFIIALIITWILVMGIKESARFNAGIVIVKVSVVLFVLVLKSA